MKKTIITLAIAFGACQAFAQDLTSKKGEPFLPEAGDWAISFDAAPFLQYAGNLFNGSTAVNGSPAVGYVKNFPWGIMAKMFKDEKTAYRAMVRLGFGTNTMTNFVIKDQATPDPNTTVTDQKKVSSNNILIGGGMEWRRGKTRLQGYYGGMLWISLGGSKTTYTYGNDFSTTYPSPTSTTNWSPITSGPAASRVTTMKAGSTFGFGLRGFIGAEYFIIPKISIGAEYGWGIGIMNTGEGSTTTQSFVSGAVKETTTKTGSTKVFGADSDISNNMLNSGSINITFHF